MFHAYLEWTVLWEYQKERFRSLVRETGQNILSTSDDVFVYLKAAIDFQCSNSTYNKIFLWNPKKWKLLYQVCDHWATRDRVVLQAVRFPFVYRQRFQVWRHEEAIHFRYDWPPSKNTKTNNTNSIKKLIETRWTTLILYRRNTCLSTARSFRTCIATSGCSTVTAGAPGYIKTERKCFKA